MKDTRANKAFRNIDELISNVVSQSHKSKKLNLP